MSLISSLVVTALLSSPAQREGFVVPLLERNRVELYYAQVGEVPRLLWKRDQRLYWLRDDEGIKGNEWIESNLLVTLSPDGKSIFVPSVFYRSGWLEVGGTILSRSGETRELRRLRIQDQEDLTLCYGWNEEHPSVVEKLESRSVTHTFESGAWKTSQTIPPSLLALESPARILGAPVSGHFMFSDSWQSSFVPARFEGMENMLLAGSRAKRLAVSGHEEVVLVEDGVITSSDLFARTENVLPLSGKRVVGRILASAQPRKTFEGLWADPADPFADSDVFVFDLKSGQKSFLGKGLFGLPVTGEWISRS